MLEKLLTEQPNPASADDRHASPPRRCCASSTPRTARWPTPWSAKSRASPAPWTPSSRALERGGRLFYIGAGTSGRLGVLDASECPPTFSVPPEMVQGIIAGGEAALSRATETTEDDPGHRRARSRWRAASPARDVLVGIAASGRTPYVLGAVAEARRLGAVTVGISCTPDSELARAVEIAITPLVGPGSDRRIDAHEGRHRAETGTEHALHRRRSSGWATCTAT